MTSPGGGRIPTIRRGSPLKLEDKLPEVTEHIRDGSLIPILGAECSLIGRPETDIWLTHIPREIAGLQAQLFGRSSVASYVQSVATTGDDRFPKEWQAPGGHDRSEGPLNDLRVALAVLGESAVRTFTGRLVYPTQAVSSSPDFWVGLGPLTDQDGQDLAFNLAAACAAAEVAKNLPQEEANALAIEDVSARLVELARSVLYGSIPRGIDAAFAHLDEQSRQALAEKLKARPEGVGKRLYLSQLAWLGDLLWHTFTFGARTYPTDSELAFRVSLQIEGTNRRLPLGAAAQRERGTIVDSLEEWFSDLYVPAGSAPRGLRDFYEAVARYLARQFHDFRAALAKPDPLTTVTPDEEEDGLSDELEPAVHRWAIGFSATFDVELERALQALISEDTLAAFHVLIPVRTVVRSRGFGRTPGSDVASLRWLLGTVDKEHSLPSPDWVRFVDADDCSIQNLALRGPVIVKLRGAPSLSEPATDWCQKAGISSVTHWLTVSESDYLYSFVLIDVMPRWCDEQLRVAPAIGFLAPSMDEWPMRLLIHDQVFPGDKGDQPPPGVIYAIGSGFERDQTEILTAWGVDVLSGDLARLTPVFAAAAVPNLRRRVRRG